MDVGFYSVVFKKLAIYVPTALLPKRSDLQSCYIYNLHKVESAWHHTCSAEIPLKILGRGANVLNADSPS